MNAYLIRIGIDSTEDSGSFNAPVNLKTMEFAYMPIRECREARSQCRQRTFDEFLAPCNKFGENLFPSRLLGHRAHIDPDFAELTYGDVDGMDVSTRKINHRGRPLRSQNLKEDDLLVFYAGLKPINYQANNGSNIIDAIIGIYVVKESIQASRLAEHGMSDSNAHTRCQFNDADIVVIAKPHVSGRLDRCIPIGGYRNKAHRVYSELLEDWGQLSIYDGYIQRSAILPSFKDPIKFNDWFKKQGRNLLQKNN